MVFTNGHAKVGGRKKGGRSKRVVAAEAYPDALAHLTAVMTAGDNSPITPDLKLRAAIALAQYQRPKPTPSHIEAFITVDGYQAPTTVEEARAALLALGERLARSEISIQAHDALVGGLRAYLSDRAAEQEKILAALEGSLRGGDT